MCLACLKFKTKRDLKISSLCLIISVAIWCVTCLIQGCSLPRLLPWALPLRHPPILPRNENAQCMSHIFKPTQSTSGAIRNHFGMKTWRMSETRAQQDLQVLTPRSSRPCQESKLTLEIRVGTKRYWKIFCEDDHLALITEEVAEFGEISTAGVSVSELLETSHLQSQMNMRDSVESSADSDPVDGE